MSKKHVINITGSCNFPRGFTITDNRIEDELQRFLTAAEYVIWRQYLRFWGSDKKKAYPSLSYLSKVTGLSEKTIRKCNKNLKDKKFINFYSGTFGRSNIYHYKPIEDIIKLHCTKNIQERLGESEEELEGQVAEVVGTRSNKVRQLLDEFGNKERVLVELFISTFESEYSNKFGFPYELDEKDINSLLLNTDIIVNEKIYKLTEVFFKTKNQFINKSDRSIYFLFRPKIIKTLISEYNTSDEGRWEAQAERIWNEIFDRLKTEKPELLDLKEWLGKKLSGGNKTRDEYILTLLTKKYKEYLYSAQ